ncbi:MAG: tetratricopeptide repeat protein [Alphaproteobacteria bacterium]|nr:tetratricopeptide repeat protein [Alphaproteobacteria bacterium]
MIRRLAAILAADVVGYSRLVGADEEGTLARFKALREELIDPAIARHDGRIVKTMGDGVLVEFPSVVDAVRNAVEVQRAVTVREADMPEDRRIAFRVGINLGDIVIDGDDILGDGVNVAARLEGLAEPGGICISAAVFEQIKGKAEIDCEDQGEQRLKNIAEPVRVFRIILDSGPTAAKAAKANAPDTDSRSKPSIAVLPFDNMSDDPEQAFLADGLAEDIITALSKLSELFVIARNSSFAYKGQSPDIRQVAEELGVQTVLEGSVRKAGNRLRITAQLIEAATGHHLWAERYDRDLADIFDLQDEITGEVVTALQVQLTEGEQVAIRRRQTKNMAAWESYSRGLNLLRRFNRQDNARARDLLERAVELDPDFAVAWSLLGWSHYNDVRFGWTKEADVLETADVFAKRSLSLDDAQPDAHAVVGLIALIRRQFEEALSYGERAVELGPNIADCYTTLAMTLVYCGRPEEALGRIEQAMRLSPFYSGWYLGIAGLVYRALGRFDEAIAGEKERMRRNPDNIFSDFRLAAIYEETGRNDEARAHVAQALLKHPHLTLRQIRISEVYRDDAQLDAYLDLLRSAGMPE